LSVTFSHEVKEESREGLSKPSLDKIESHGPREREEKDPNVQVEKGKVNSKWNKRKGGR